LVAVSEGTTISAKWRSLRALAAEVTVFYASNLMMPFSLKISKIARLMPIVAET
jgi:hypothetical protein